MSLNYNDDGSCEIDALNQQLAVLQAELDNFKQHYVHQDLLFEAQEKLEAKELYCTAMMTTYDECHKVELEEANNQINEYIIQNEVVKQRARVAERERDELRKQLAKYEGCVEVEGALLVNGDLFLTKNIFRRFNAGQSVTVWVNERREDNESL